MNRVSDGDLEWVEGRSPKGQYHRYMKLVSTAMKGPEGKDATGGRRPFDVCFLRVPPGKKAWPFHRHFSQWEFYYVVEGQGKMRLDGDEYVAFKAGDSLLCPPGEAHQIVNDSDGDVVLQIIADNPISDPVEYPDSGKWYIRPPGKLVRVEEARYYDGEE